MQDARVVPGEESKVLKCPICKEQLGTQFLEDDEEWVWRNAITQGTRLSWIARDYR